MAILVDRETRVVIQGITGREASMVAGHMSAYGTQVVAGVTPGRGGAEASGIPVYDTLSQALSVHRANTALTYVPPFAAYDAVMEAIACGIRLIVIPAESIPQYDVMRMLTAAAEAGVCIVGPNVVGILSPGERAKVGAIGGQNADRFFAPGRIGIISRSGGMTTELAWMLRQAGLGVSTAVSVGGDPLLGTPPRDCLRLFQEDADTDAVVLFSEPGTQFEERVADLLIEGAFTKPLITYVAGRFTERLPEGTTFGHAAALIQGKSGRPSEKIARLRSAGAVVAESFEGIVGLITGALR